MKRGNSLFIYHTVLKFGIDSMPFNKITFYFLVNIVKIFKIKMVKSENFHPEYSRAKR